MKPIVIAFSGSIASGKSTLSGEVAKKLQWHRVSFGDYVRSVAHSQGLAESRESLQVLGAEFVEKDVKRFCRSVLEQSDWQPGQHLVIDGIRHVKVLEILKQLVSPMKLYLIFISVDKAVQAARLAERKTQDLVMLQSLNLDSTEQQVTTFLKNMADFVVDSSHSVEETTQDITDWLHSQCAKD